MLSPVSTWMGDRLGTLGAVGIFFVFDSTIILPDVKEEVDRGHQSAAWPPKGGILTGLDRWGRVGQPLGQPCVCEARAI